MDASQINTRHDVFNQTQIAHQHDIECTEAERGLSCPALRGQIGARWRARAAETNAIAR
jgi:hypothetical protein